MKKIKEKIILALLVTSMVLSVGLETEAVGQTMGGNSLSQEISDNEGYDLIEQYYTYVNEGEAESIQSLYGAELQEFVAPFFEEADSKVLHQGIYNVINTEVLFIKKIDNGAYENDAYFVKCNMNVYESDKYYRQGINYFMFWTDVNENGDLEISNIEIPTYQVLLKNDTKKDDVKEFQRARNEMIYGTSVTPRLTDYPVYIDTVGNPLTIRVKGYGSVNFKDYLKGVAANEINTLPREAARAGAMASKMYAIHFINTAASGASYDINASTQVYNPNTQISATAQAAVDYVEPYFLLGGYGENFKTFFVTQYDSSNEVAKYSYKNGGVLSHVESASLANNSNYTWRQILSYYYEKGTATYIPKAKTSSSIIITTAHNHDWSNAYYCPYCGAEVY